MPKITVRVIVAFIIGAIFGLMIPGIASGVLGWWIHTHTWTSKPGQLLTVSQVAPGHYQIWQDSEDEKTPTMESIPADAAMIHPTERSSQSINKQAWTTVLDVQVQRDCELRVTPTSQVGRVMLQSPMDGVIILTIFMSVFAGLFVWWLSAVGIHRLLGRLPKHLALDDKPLFGG